MTAALGKILILDLYSIGAGALEFAHGARHVERVAITGVGVDDEVGGYAVADHADRMRHLVHADEADIRPTQSRIGNGGPGYIQRGKPSLRRDQRRERVINAGRHDNALARETRVQTFR